MISALEFLAIKSLYALKKPLANQSLCVKRLALQAVLMHKSAIRIKTRSRI